jgi:pyruvate ferredoxin oxidoreductase gamma subunit
MIEIRIHGRGGQGGVTAAELLAQAVIHEGNYSQGFPSFGPERRGAPVTAYIRMSEEKLYLREPIDKPDVVVVMDSSLIDMVNVFEGMKSGGTLVINASASMTERLQEMATAQDINLAVIDASAIATEVLGVPITNTAIIGAIVKATNLCQVSALDKPLENRFGRLAAKNRKAMLQAYENTQMLGDKSIVETGVEDAYELDALCSCKDLEIGAEIVTPGNSVEFETGNWRTAGRPATDYEKCIKCGLCWLLCPDIAYSKNEEGFFDWDGQYCKGCAICVVECPKDAIEMQGETS